LKLLYTDAACVGDIHSTVVSEKTVKKRLQTAQAADTEYVNEWISF